MKNLIGREHSINPQIMLKIYKKTIIEFGFRMISWIIKTQTSVLIIHDIMLNHIQ